MSLRVPGGIRARLALGLVLIAGVALVAAYLLVVPSLEQRLVGAKLDQMTRDASTIAGTALPEDPVRLQQTAELASLVANARVVIYDIASRRPPGLFVRADSNPVSSADMAANGTALGAVEDVSARGRAIRDEREYGEIAVRTATGQVVLLAAPLDDALATVAVIERRLLLAAALALAVAVVLGSMAAAAHARRIRRLERAADRIATGHFDEPVVDEGDDELGQLARAFDRMREQLAQLDRARRAFVANASHELRTPLFSLGGFLELLADEDLDEETRERFLVTMRGQVERLTTLTTDLLDLSRMDAGQLRVEATDVDLGEVARVVADEYHALAESSEHELAIEVEPEPWAYGDEERVIQIGRVLVGNGLLHTPPGTRVTIRARSGSEVSVLEVEDDGPGIPEEHLDQLFQRFYRVEGREASGSGLGLAIAHELAVLMGGDVRVTSRPGRTVFALELPPSREIAAPRELVSV